MTKKSDSTRQKIISSAEILFYSKGVSQTTQQELANLAGVNRGLIHYYFGSKEHLALQISRRFTSSFYTAVNELFLKDEPNVVFKSITQGRLLFKTIFANRNFERFIMEELHGRVVTERVEDYPVYRDFCDECAYLGLTYSEEEKALYSIAIASVEHKLFAAKTTGLSSLPIDEIISIYNRIHLGILGLDREAQEALIARSIAFSSHITFVNNGNFDVKPAFFLYR